METCMRTPQRTCTIEDILRVVRKRDRDKLTHLYRSENGKIYEFDDYGKLKGEYLGEVPKVSYDYSMPPELEEQVRAAKL